MERTLIFDPPRFAITVDIPEGVDELDWAYEWAEMHDAEVMEHFEEIMAQTYFDIEVD